MSDDEIAAALGEAIESFASRILERREPPPAPDPPPDPERHDRLLKPTEAATRLSVSRQWFHDHKDLPFVVRLPNGALRVSERKLEAYLENMNGHP